MGFGVRVGVGVGLGAHVARVWRVKGACATVGMRVSKPGGSSVSTATAGRARVYAGAVARSVDCERQSVKGNEERRASILGVMAKIER